MNHLEKIIYKTNYIVGKRTLNEEVDWESQLTPDEKNELNKIYDKYDELEEKGISFWEEYKKLKDSNENEKAIEARDKSEYYRKEMDKLNRLISNIKDIGRSKQMNILALEAIKNFEPVRLQTTQTNFPDYNISHLYPKEYFPFLWDNPYNPESIQFHYLMISPNLIHTVWRGINPNELEYIKQNKHIKSAQEYNIGYEVERGLTVYGYLPKTGISYAGGFAPKQYRPTEQQPNYLIQIKANQPENAFFYDKNDEYIKTSKPISSSQIEGIWEVYPNEQIKDISNILPL